MGIKEVQLDKKETLAEYKSDNSDVIKDSNVNNGIKQATKEGNERVQDQSPDEAPSSSLDAKSIVNLTSDPLTYDLSGNISFPSVNAAPTGAFYQIRSIEELKPEEGRKKSEELLPTKGVRRPLLGLAEKENTFASLELRKSSTGDKPPKNLLYDSLKGVNEKNTNYTFNFFVKGLNQSYTEKSQLIETFGKTYFFFFGQSPMILSIQGALLNSKNFNWRNDFIKNYLETFRGTQAAKEGLKTVLTFDDLMIYGYISDFTLQEGNTRLRELSNFSLTLIATDIEVFDSYNYNEYESGKELTQEYFEYVGPYGTATKEGSPKENKAIYIYTSFADILAKYIGFNLRSINRIEALTDIIASGDWKSQKAYGITQWSTWSEQAGADIYEFDRILNNSLEDI